MDDNTPTKDGKMWMTVSWSSQHSLLNHPSLGPPFRIFPFHTCPRAQVPPNLVSLATNCFSWTVGSLVYSLCAYCIRRRPCQLAFGFESFFTFTLVISTANVAFPFPVTQQMMLSQWQVPSNSTYWIIFLWYCRLFYQFKSSGACICSSDTLPSVIFL